MTKEEWLGALEQRHGKALQKRFSAAAVAVCGLGGLGSNVAIALARTGVGTLHLIDFDRVDISNLNRQQYGVSQLGMYKTEAMRQTLAEVAPYCNVISDSVKLTEKNLSLLSKCEIICECFDCAESKAMLVNNVAESFPEKYIVAASGMAGLNSSNTIRTKKLTDRIFLCGDGISDVSACGTLYAPRVMLCAAHQAAMAVRLLAGEKDC